MSATLLAGLSLPQGVPLRSPNGAYHLVVQADGNLVLYVSQHFHPANALWASGTNGRGEGPYRLDMQKDGNLVLYDRTDRPLWASNTHGRETSGARDKLEVRDDATLVLLRGSEVRWSFVDHKRN